MRARPDADGGCREQAPLLARSRRGQPEQDTRAPLPPRRPVTILSRSATNRRDRWLCHLYLLAVAVYAVINSPIVGRLRVYQWRVDLLFGLGVPAVANLITFWRAGRCRAQRAAWLTLSVA